MESKPVYFYKFTNKRNPVALINVRLFNGQFPPVVEWNETMYYWNGDRGWYCSWLLKDDIDKITKEDVVTLFQGRQ